MNDHCDQEFQALLRGFDRADLARSANVVYGCWSDLRLAYFNASWLTFADKNGGGSAIVSQFGLGARLVDAISDPLRDYYVTKWQNCLSEGEPWEHVYECSSPTHLRKYHMTVFPLAHGQGGLSINSLVVEEPHDPHERPACDPITPFYTDADNTLHQCMHCRRFRRGGGDEQWDWVPSWVSECPPNASHGLCQSCLDFYYPDVCDPAGG